MVVKEEFEKNYCFICSQLAGYENDFKIERQEKVRAVADRDHVSRERDQIAQRYEHLKQEHINLRQNIERMYTQAQAQQQQVRVLKNPRFCALHYTCFMQTGYEDDAFDCLIVMCSWIL